MTTKLKGEKLFSYLNGLEKTEKEMADQTDEGYLESLMHLQIAEIASAESVFLKSLHKDKAQLSIRLNGFPSSQSLIPDLEAMCEISKEGKKFQGIAKKFKIGKNHKELYENEEIYMSVSEEEWDEELEIRKEHKSELSSKIGFSVDETCDGHFELSLREEIYLNGYDEYSKKFPIMVREGKMTCYMIWDSIIEGFEKNFYVPNKEFELKGKQKEPSRKSFEGIEKFYKFGRSDYKTRKPLFLKWGGDSIDYSKFLAAGTETRVKTTENILETINLALNKEIIIKEIKKGNLEKVLAFSWVPFKNAPKSTLDNYQLEEIKKKNNTCFNLVYNSGGRKIGEIEYLLPHNYKKYSDDDGFEFILGGIRLEINGSAILDENQEENLKEGLKEEKVKKKKYFLI